MPDEQNPAGSIEPDQSSSPAVSPLEGALAGLWSTVLQLPHVAPDDNFFLIGGDSLQSVQLCEEVKTVFGVDLPIESLFGEAGTVAGMAAMIEEIRKKDYGTTGINRAASGESGNPSIPCRTNQDAVSLRALDESKGHTDLIPLTAGGSLPPVFAVPGGTGSAFGFAELARRLGPNQTFYAFQFPGLDGKHAPLDTIEAVASVCVADIRAIQPRGPYAIIGFCFGSIVAYEAARQILAMGERVAFLGLLDPAQRLETKASGLSLSVWRPVRRAFALGIFVQGRLQMYSDEIRELSARDRLKYVFRKARRLPHLFKVGERVSSGVEREFNQVEVFRANVTALDRYRGRPLSEPMPLIEVFECEGRSTLNRDNRFSSLWEGNCRRHLVPGKEAGDSLRGQNGQFFAELLAQSLRAAHQVSSNVQPLGPVSITATAPR